MRILCPCFTGFLQSLIYKKQDRAPVPRLHKCIFLLLNISLWLEDSPSLFPAAPAVDHNHAKGTIQFCGTWRRVKPRPWQADDAQRNQTASFTPAAPLSPCRYGHPSFAVGRAATPAFQLEKEGGGFLSTCCY